jgi:serine/threonine-protein kinase RsbT
MFLTIPEREKIMAISTNAREGSVPINTEADIVVVRKVTREVATDLGFGVTDVTRIVTAASELARNIFKYAGEGKVRWRSIYGGVSTGIELVFIDDGPGIPDLNKAMQPGFSTGGGLGMGLPGAKRLMDEMEIHSEVGKGTIVVVKKWLKKL